MKNVRKSDRAQREQLLTLLNGWDPAGVIHAGGRRDQYEGFVDRLLDLLSRNPATDEVTGFLRGEIRGTFGVDAPDPELFATKALTWYHLSESES